MNQVVWCLCPLNISVHYFVHAHILIRTLSHDILSSWLAMCSFSSRLCRGTKLGLISSFARPLSHFFSLSRFSSSSSSSTYTRQPTPLRFSRFFSSSSLFSILHHITNRRRQLMNWRRRRYIAFEFLHMMDGRGQARRKHSNWKKNEEEEREKTNIFVAVDVR